MDIVSKPYHDAALMGLHVPTAMIFVPCRDGLSHHPDEYASPKAVQVWFLCLHLPACDSLHVLLLCAADSADCACRSQPCMGLLLWLAGLLRCVCAPTLLVQLHSHALSAWLGARW